VIHLLALFAFGVLKLTFVAIRWNPEVSVFDEAGQHVTEEEGINLKKIKF
jgi:hypothetical protein